MKKFISFLLIIVLTISATNAFAQLTMTQKDPAGATSTVNTNADTSYHSVDLAGNTNNYDCITIVMAGTKTSGTVAGTAIVQASMDNSRWFTIADTSAVTTQNLTDGDTNFKWEYNKTRWRYYRVRVITTGTQVSAYTCRLLGRKFPY